MLDGLLLTEPAAWKKLPGEDEDEVCLKLFDMLFLLSKHAVVADMGYVTNPTIYASLFQIQ